MKGQFLSLRGAERRGNPKKLIIFLNGWSLDENFVKHMTSDNYDVLMFYDYSDFEIAPEILEEIKTYEEINVIAFSFGVWAFGYALRHCEALAEAIQIDSWIAASPSAPRNDMAYFSLNQVVAINGTLIPIDDKFGISEKMFDLTLNNLSEKTYPKFFQNMFDESFSAPHPSPPPQGGRGISKMFPKRTIENQRKELQQIKNSTLFPPPLRGRARVGGISSALFTKVFIGVNDKIIPAKNQIAFWQGKTPIIEKQSGHYIDFKSWDEIIDG